MNRSEIEGRIESIHSIKSLEEIESRSRDLGAILIKDSLKRRKVAVVVAVTSVEVTCSEEMIALCFFTLLVKCLIKVLGKSALGQMVGNKLGGCLFESVLTIWCSS